MSTELQPLPNYTPPASIQKLEVPKRAKMFLRLLAETGQVSRSWHAAGYSDSSTIYHLKRTNAAFRKAWDESVEQAGDLLEDEARRRATEGVVKDVYFKGEVCGQEVVYSDGLMAKLLDGAKPEKYNRARETKTDVSVKVGVGIAVIPMTAPNVEDWERQSLELHQQVPVVEGQFTEVVPARQPDRTDPPRKVVLA